LNGTDINPIAQWFVDVLAGTIPKGFYHPCSYFGELKACNVALKITNQILQFLTGSYKI
jgi:hypothetical protein